MNNKFNIGDKVTVNKLGVAEGWLLETYIVITGKQVGKISVKDTTGEVWHIPSEYVELIEPNTIEEDTPYLSKEEIKEQIMETYIKEHIGMPKGRFVYKEKTCGATAGLDYEKEYYKEKEKHEETKELLEIAKVALKLTTELISTNDRELI
jgi:hypothetical protein